MTDRDTILAAYERHEKALGGAGWAKEAVDAAAEELGIERAEVVRVVLDNWTLQGAG